MPQGGKGYYIHTEQYEGPDTPFTPGKVEFDTLTCHRCKNVVILNPERKRSRGYCYRHDAYLCDPCHGAIQSVQCESFEEMLENMIKGKSL